VPKFAKNVCPNLTDEHNWAIKWGEFTCKIPQITCDALNYVKKYITAMRNKNQNNRCCNTQLMAFT